MRIHWFFPGLLVLFFMAACGSDENIIEFGDRPTDDGGSGLGSGTPDLVDDVDGADGDTVSDVLPASVQVIINEYLGEHTATNVREVFGSNCEEVSFNVTQNGKVLTVSPRVYRCQNDTRDTGFPLILTVNDEGKLFVEGIESGSITADVLSVENFYTYGNCSENDFAITLIDAANSGVFDYMCNTDYTFLGDL